MIRAAQKSIGSRELDDEVASIECLRPSHQDVFDRHGRVQISQTVSQGGSNFVAELPDRVGATLTKGAQVRGFKR